MSHRRRHILRPQNDPLGDFNLSNLVKSNATDSSHPEPSGGAAVQAMTKIQSNEVDFAFANVGCSPIALLANHCRKHARAHRPESYMRQSQISSGGVVASALDGFATSDKKRAGPSSRRLFVMPTLLLLRFMYMYRLCVPAFGDDAADVIEAGPVCGSGRRRRSIGDSDCTCTAYMGGLCIDFKDNCCEPIAAGCCIIANNCSTSDVACFQQNDNATTTTTTAVPCPWLQRSYSDEFLCNDGLSCLNVTCCDDHRGRKRCPWSRPTMCNNRTCGDRDDWCCGATCKTDGGPRLCLVGQAVHASVASSIFVAADKVAWSIGANGLGNLGDGTRNNQVTLTPMSSFVHSLSIGESHTVVLKEDGTVWTVGSNKHGQLGDDTVDTRPTLALVDSVGATAVEAGGLHTILLRRDGFAWATGWNLYGQLGDGTTIDRNVFVKVLLSDIVSVSAGSAHTVFLRASGEAWAVGSNVEGQLGDGTSTDKSTPTKILTDIKAVCAGVHHTLYVMSNGSVLATGLNNYGQLGDGTKTHRFTPVVVLELSNIEAVSCGTYHSLFLRRDSSVFAVGYNLLGQLGDGTQIDRTVPVFILKWVYAVSAGDSHSLFLCMDGTVLASGFNKDAQLGDTSLGMLRTVPTRVLSSIFPPPPKSVQTTTTPLGDLTMDPALEAALVAAREEAAAIAAARAEAAARAANSSAVAAQDGLAGSDDLNDDYNSKMVMEGGIIAACSAVGLIWVVAVILCCFIRRPIRRLRKSFCPCCCRSALVSAIRPADEIDWQKEDWSNNDVGRTTDNQDRDADQGGLSWRVKNFDPLREEASNVMTADSLVSPVHRGSADTRPGPPLELIGGKRALVQIAS